MADAPNAKPASARKGGAGGAKKAASAGAGANPGANADTGAGAGKTGGKLRPADFASDQEVRWCPGCGDYAIIKAVRQTMANVGARPENTLIVSGIGCSSRFPYYMETFGIHAIHGRAPTIASGAMLANPDLDVWIITGDGDALAIGGNHFIHLLRRNFNCQLLLFNNEIYGLTKGQCSPTSPPGLRTPTTPFGAIDPPVEPAALALGAGAGFVARAVDSQQKQLVEILTAAHQYKGTGFVEIFQNCIVFNDGIFDDFTGKRNAAEHQLIARHGQPLTYGKNGEKGVFANGDDMELKTGAIGKGASPLIHDETSRPLAFALAALSPAKGEPMVTGILHRRPAPSYQARVNNQFSEAKEQMRRKRKKEKERSLQDALAEGATWRVKI
jgi:2-oxoglutarate ferredoxin oxidoreductase subunit beta